MFCPFFPFKMCRQGKLRWKKVPILSNSWLYPQCPEKSLAQWWQPLRIWRRIIAVSQWQSPCPPKASSQEDLSQFLPAINLQQKNLSCLWLVRAPSQIITVQSSQPQVPLHWWGLAAEAGTTALTLGTHSHQHPTHTHSPWQPLALSACISPGRQRMDGPSGQCSVASGGLQKPIQWYREWELVPKLSKNQQSHYFPLNRPAV